MRAVPTGLTLEAYLDMVPGSQIVGCRVRPVIPPLQGVAAQILDLELPVISGSVNFDGSAEIYSTLDLTLAPFYSKPSQYEAPASNVVYPLEQGQGDHGTKVWPDDTDDLLNFNRELFVEVKIDLGDGTAVYVPMGYYRVYDIGQTNSGEIRVSANDRSALLRDYTDPFTQYLFLVQHLETLFDRFQGPNYYPWYPTAITDWTYHSKALHRDIMPSEKTAYEILKDIADAFGKWLHYDGAGVLNVKAIPASTSDAVWTVPYGTVTISRERSLTRDGAYNAVKAVSSDPDFPDVYAVAVDNDPDSPTYWNGPFGRVVRNYASPFISWAGQAESAALAMLERTLGIRSIVSLETVPNVLLEPFDVIEVYAQDDPDSLEYHQIESVTIPLGPGTMKITTKARRAFGGEIITE